VRIDTRRGVEFSFTSDGRRHRRARRLVIVDPGKLVSWTDSRDLYDLVEIVVIPHNLRNLTRN